MTVIEDQDLATRLMALFEGFAEAYGTYESSDYSERKGKLEIKSTAKTLRAPVTRELWQDHISGKHPLGIIPIRRNGTCLWGVIDVDQYGIEHTEVVERIEREKLPLVVCRSKSGGAHLFLFMKEPIESTILIAKLSEIAALLGFGGTEIFPKQQSVATERGDLGNWLNMPYFEGDQTTRFCVKKNGLAMTVPEFLHYAEGRKVAPEFFDKQHRRTSDLSDPVFGDGPPCMQHLTSSGFPEGVRNKGLFALGVFAKRKFGDKWALQIEKWNHQYFEPPLNSTEVADVIKSLEKKDYNYSCRDQPLAAHCNSVLCRSRRFGVGGNDDYPVIGGLSVLDTQPKIWFLDVDESRVELATDELMNYELFRKVCFERLFKFYRPMKKETWQNILAQQLANVVKIEASEEISDVGHFVELLEKFVTDKHKAENKEEILLGKPWLDEDNNRYYFRMQDLIKFLDSEGFKVYNRAQVSVRINEMKGGKHFFNIKEKGTNTWWVPAEIFKSTPELELPSLERSPI